MSVGTAQVEESRGDWLSDLYQAHAGAVRAYCHRFLNSPDDAADAAHEVFVRAIGSLQAPARSPQARRWLITVAQNYCLDLMRRRRRMQSALTVLASDGEPQHDSETEVMNRRLLQAVLSQLGQRERQALWQSAIQHRSLGEIAASLGISYMAAAQVLHRARKHATAVASKLGALLGLAGANALRRRPRALGLAQSLAAMAIAPLVIAVATPSSSGHAADLWQRSPTTSVKPSHASPAPNNPSTQLLTQVSMAEPNEHRLRRIPQKLGTAFHSLLGTVTQTLDQLTSPASGVTHTVVPSPPALPAPPALPSALPTPPIRP